MESNETLRALEKIAQESKQTIETLRQVKAERPQMLGPLMLAYEVTDGKVNSIRCIINGEPDNFVPLSEENRHYVEIMKQVKAGTLTIADAD